MDPLHLLSSEYPQKRTITVCESYDSCIIVKSGGFLLNFTKNLKIKVFYSFFLQFFFIFQSIFQYFDECSEIAIILMIIRHFLQIYFYDSVFFTLFIFYFLSFIIRREILLTEDRKIEKNIRARRTARKDTADK